MASFQIFHASSQNWAQSRCFIFILKFSMASVAAFFCIVLSIAIKGYLVKQ